MVAALIAAGLVSWFLVRRVAHPVVDLADAADAVAAGDYAVRVPAEGFGSELTRLSQAFDRMANRLAATDATRTSMLADLAHELRTPLATLEAYIDGLEDGVVPVRRALVRGHARPGRARCAGSPATCGGRGRRGARPRAGPHAAGPGRDRPRRRRRGTPRATRARTCPSS